MNNIISQIVDILSYISPNTVPHIKTIMRRINNMPEHKVMDLLDSLKKTAADYYQRKLTENEWLKSHKMHEHHISNEWPPRSNEPHMEQNDDKLKTQLHDLKMRVHDLDININNMHQQINNFYSQMQFNKSPMKITQIQNYINIVINQLKFNEMDKKKLEEQIEQIEHQIGYTMHPIDHTMHPIDHTMHNTIHPIDHSMHPIDHSMHPIDHPMHHSIQHSIQNSIHHPIHHSMHHSIHHSMHHSIHHPMNDYIYIGSYHDRPQRAIGRRSGNVNNVHDAILKAKSEGAILFGIQDGGQLFINEHRLDPMEALRSAKKYGKDYNCHNELGCAWVNQVYMLRSEYERTLMHHPMNDYIYIGSYNDRPNRAIGRRAGKVHSVHDAMLRAKSEGAVLFGIQDDGQLFINEHRLNKMQALKSAKKYGKNNNCHHELGCAWVNQVYMLR